MRHSAIARPVVKELNPIKLDAQGPHLAVPGEGKLAQNRQGGFELVRCDQNTAYLHTHEYIIARILTVAIGSRRAKVAKGSYSMKVMVSSSL